MFTFSGWRSWISAKSLMEVTYWCHLLKSFTDVTDVTYWSHLLKLFNEVTYWNLLLKSFTEVTDVNFWSHLLTEVMYWSYLMMSLMSLTEVIYWSHWCHLLKSSSSWLTVTRFPFCASVSRRGTNFAATRRIFSLSVKIWRHELFQIPTSWQLHGQLGDDFGESKQALSQCDHRPLTWKVVQIWGLLRWMFCPIWNTGTTRDIAYGSNNPLHKPVATSQKSQ